MKKYLILCVMLTVVAGVRSAWAAEYFVNPRCASGCDGISWVKGWSSFSSINWTTLNTGGPNTLYIARGDYASPLVIDHTGPDRLYIRPGSASPSPSGYDGMVTVRGIALGSSRVIRYVTISGETAVGSGTRNMKVAPTAGKGVYGWDANSKTDSGLQIFYLEIDGSAQSSSCQFHGLEIPQQLCNVEIAHNYIHDMRGNAVFQSLIHRWQALPRLELFIMIRCRPIMGINSCQIGLAVGMYAIMSLGLGKLCEHSGIPRRWDRWGGDVNESL
jgi:hypothetical protein